MQARIYVLLLTEVSVLVNSTIEYVQATRLQATACC